ncbi:hypothetical protein [Streptomyces sp. NPDC012510]|uniref:hypothetical protein n=1 Tax=Streptomyces sp. NPDC012510 TaxID=3364838 RepID=UPI0036F095EF
MSADSGRVPAALLHMHHSRPAADPALLPEEQVAALARGAVLPEEQVAALDRGAVQAHLARRRAHHDPLGAFDGRRVTPGRDRER